MSYSKVQCQDCGMQMSPRIYFLYGRPHNSYCPFCGSIYKSFTEESFFRLLLTFFYVVLAMIISLPSFYMILEKYSYIRFYITPINLLKFSVFLFAIGYITYNFYLIYYR